MAQTTVRRGRLRSLLAAVALAAIPAAAGAADKGFGPDLIVSSTVPPNGDQNPYGVAFVPPGFPTDGTIQPGNVLVSNFNNKKNLQGTGGTIVVFDGDVHASGNADVFFDSKGLGLTTALGVTLNYVVVGSMPTTDGTLNTVQPGALLFLDENANLLPASPFATQIDGPWDLVIAPPPSGLVGASSFIFVSNVLNGTVVRLNTCVCAPPLPVITSVTTVATGYTVQPNAAALVLGPTGLAYDPGTDTLYVASTADNQIFAVANAETRKSASGPGSVVFTSSHLRGPLALAFAPDGDLFTANGDAVNAKAAHPSTIVEFTTNGNFVKEFNIDAAQGGAFGLAFGAASGKTVPFAFVDDNTSSLTILGCRLDGC